MPELDFRVPRLFVDAPLHEGQTVALERGQSNYLGNVLRLGAGDTILVFNGQDGEWRAAIAGRKRPDMLRIESQSRAQDRLPVTRFTQVSRVNGERMRANVIEAAEQCGILSLAAVADPMPLERFLDARNQKRLLVFCDEAADVADPFQALRERPAGGKGVDVLVGPEGGFAEDERTLLLRQPQIVKLALGPRVLRADTAAVAALALVQATLGDWIGRAK